MIRWYLKHIILLLLGIFLMAASVALAKLAGLGTSPISSIPNVGSLLTPLTIGQVTIIFMVVLIALEWAILRREFGWGNLIQLLPSAVFGTLIDGCMRLFHALQPVVYWQQLGLTLISLVVLALGVFLEVNSRTLVMAGEGIAAAVSLRTHRPFGTMKVRCDLAMVVGAVALALLGAHSLIGVREGTVLSAILTGRLVNGITTYFPRLTAWVQD